MFRWINSRARRRGLVVAATLSIANLLSLTWRSPRIDLLVVGSFLLMGATLISVGVATFGMADIPLRRLDEQQRQMRLSLFPDPYVVGANIGLLGGLLSARAISDDRDLFLAPIVVSIFALPALVMAWKLPDNVADDE